MENKTKELQRRLDVCKSQLLGLKTVINIPWLNDFCGEIVGFANTLQNFLAFCIKTLGIKIKGNLTVETIFLCLLQMVTCINYLQKTIKAKDVNHTTIFASKQYFLDRMQWCLERVDISLRILAEDPFASTQTPLEQQTFVEVIDTVLKKLSPYSGCQTKSDVINEEIENDAALESEEIRSLVDRIASHALAFANVALKQQKKSLTACCQRMLAECIGFQMECALEDQCANNRMLKAVSLENAISNVEASINKAINTLIYTCFLDIEDISIKKMRDVMQKSNPNDSTVNDYIADFDNNIDRLTQIGIFAIAYAPDIKTKTTIRSCLASLESLDINIIAALQSSKVNSEFHSIILEQHYEEEIAIVKEAIQGTIVSEDFMTSYIEILWQCLGTMERRFHKPSLLEMVQMATILYQHFSLKVNHKDFINDSNSPKFIYFYKFVTILRECEAILRCDDQIDPKLILQQFKLMWSTLIQFRDLFNNNNSHPTNLKDQEDKKEKKEMKVQSKKHKYMQYMFDDIEICPSSCNIFYSKDVPKVNPTKSPLKRTKNNLEELVNGAKRLTMDIVVKIKAKITK